MKPLRPLWEIFRSVRRRRELGQDLDEELESHIELATAENIAAGMTAREARRKARLDLGGMDAAREQVRDEWRIPWLETLPGDAFFALRTFRRNRVFSIAAVSTLAIGIGAITAVFSIVNAVLLKPFGIPDADRVVILTYVSPQGTQAGGAPATFNLWSEQTEVFEDLAAFGQLPRNYTGGDVPEPIMTARVSEAFFRSFGLPVVEGRGFVPEDMLPGAPKVVVISQAMRERSFDPDEEVLGRRVELSGISYEVVGVTGTGFDLGQLPSFRLPPQAYLPVEIAPNSTDQAAVFSVVARLRDGVTLEQARDRMGAAAVTFHERYPGFLPGSVTFGAEPFVDFVVGNARRTLWILTGAVSFVLLIACANAANLFLVWAGGRSREMGVRVAVGAGRGHLIRQVVTESVLLFLVAGALGLALGIAGIRALLAVNTSGLPRVGEAGVLVVLDWRVLAFALTASLVTGIVFGLIPATAASRVDVNTALKDTDHGGGRGPGRARKLLVTGEIALAVILLIGAGLLIRTRVATQAIDPGFDPRNTLIMGTTLDEGAAMADTMSRIESALERLRQLPGIESATVTCGPCLPLQFGLTMPWLLPEFPPRGGGPASRWVAATDDYFEVLGIQQLAGRVFGPDDRAGTSPVVVINQRMRETFFPDSDPIGRDLLIGRGRPGFEAEPARTIIGVVGDVPDGDLRNAVTPRMYVPIAQLPEPAANAVFSGSLINWAVRTDGNPYRLREQMEEILVATMGVAVSNVQSAEDYVNRSLGGQRFNLFLMTVFAAAAVLLAAVGIFGMVAYVVEQRRHEIGIRLALGADPGQIGRRTLGDGLTTAAAGIGLGMLASYWLVQVLAGFLYDVEPRDPVVFTAAPLAVLVVALLASGVPAHRASRIEPSRALRHE
jgi:predicted permease